MVWWRWFARFRSTQKFHERLTMCIVDRVSFNYITSMYRSLPANSYQSLQTSLIVIGATGSLGRQIVYQAFARGYVVLCMVRPRERSAQFLREMGASIVFADLTRHKSIPESLCGVEIIVDAGTARPEESIREVDWYGKITLIQSAQCCWIQRYIFYSIIDCDIYNNIPLLNIKYCTESYLRSSLLHFTIMRLCSFMQSVIGSYVIPMMERNNVWGSRQSRFSYVDTCDIARLTLKCIDSSLFNRRTISVYGPKTWSSSEVVSLCEALSVGGAKANVIEVPVWVNAATRSILNRVFVSKDAGARLSFGDMSGVRREYHVAFDFSLVGCSLVTLQRYIQEYFSEMFNS